MIEVRWHARAGQGAKSASQILALAAVAADLNAQAFPEYGPERAGAPMRAFNRLSPQPIRVRNAVTTPTAVVVLEERLLGEIDVADGLTDNGALLVATTRPAGEIRNLTDWAGQLVCLDATALAGAAGARAVNIVMLGALAGVLATPPPAALHSAVNSVFSKKLKPAALAELAASLDAGLQAGPSAPHGGR